MRSEDHSRDLNASFIVLGDGAKWIWDEVAASFGAERIEIVDWYHANQHLWTLAKALHGEGTPATTAWANQAAHLLWKHGPAPLLALLAKTTARTPEAAKVVQTERGYFTSNALRMHYSQFRRQGLPVGSGAVESAAKHLVQQRLKRAGMRWSDCGARLDFDQSRLARTKVGYTRTDTGTAMLPAQAAVGVRIDGPTPLWWTGSLCR